MTDYEPQTWANNAVGETPLSAARLNHMEAGIDQAAVDASISIRVPDVDAYLDSSPSGASSVTAPAGGYATPNMRTLMNDQSGSSSPPPTWAEWDSGNSGQVAILEDGFYDIVGYYTFGDSTLGKRYSYGLEFGVPPGVGRYQPSSLDEHGWFQGTAYTRDIRTMLLQHWIEADTMVRLQELYNNSLASVVISNVSMFVRKSG